MTRQSHRNRRAQMGIGIFLAAVLVAVVAGPLTVLRAGETTTQPTTQPARKDQPSAATQPAAGKQDEAGQLPQLRFLMWQEEDETSRENPTVWAPDGESVKDETDLKVLQQINVGTMGGGPDETWRYLFLFFSHPDIDHSTIIRVAIVDADGIEIIGSGSQNYSLHPRGERGNPDDSGWAVVVRSPGKIEDEIPKSVDIMLRYSLRPWEEVGTLGGVFESPATVDDITVEKAEEITVDQAHVDLTGDGKVGDVRTKLHVIRDLDIARRMQFDIVAVMLDGREVIRSKRSLIRSGPGGVEKVCFWFDAPQSDIKLFKFCVRPIRVVTFKNVSLEPGTITKPTVVGDPPPAATPVKNPATKPAAK